MRIIDPAPGDPHGDAARFPVRLTCVTSTGDREVRTVWLPRSGRAVVVHGLEVGARCTFRLLRSDGAVWSRFNRPTVVVADDPTAVVLTGRYPALVSMWFQVDRYLNPTTRLAARTQGYLRDGVLTYREDRPHWGRSRWAFIRVTVPVGATRAQIMAAINRQTSAAIGDVRRTVRTGRVRGDVTVAWRLAAGASPAHPWGMGRNRPQRFFAMS